MLENSEVKLWGKKSGGPAQLRQLWKIQHVERDYYSIRSAYRHDLALFADGTNIKMATLDTALTPEETPLNLQWRISRDVNSFVIQYVGTSSLTLRPAEGTLSPGTDLTVANVTPTNSYTWTLGWKTVEDQILLINTQTGLPSTNAVRYVAPGESLTLADMNLMATFVSKSTNNQDLVWTEDGSRTALVDSETGTVTGARYREIATISVQQTDSSAIAQTFSVSVTIAPTSPPLKAQTGNLRCWAAVSQMMALYYFPTITAGQDDLVKYIFQGEEERGGSMDDTVNAINYLIGTVSDEPTNVMHTSRGTILSENGLTNYLDAGHPVIISRGYYEKGFGPGLRTKGHMGLVTDYVTISGENYFIFMDPWPTNDGDTFAVTYEELREGTFPNNPVYRYWDAVIVYNNQFLDDTIVLYTIE
ncbi:MAG: hypothetical protein IJV82_01605 [Oscillospiraceae bacterium]|nr:hypothetical protein [Oscillospiraceae bacterium]